MKKKRHSPLDSLSALDFRFLDRALALAERGRYSVSPNPMVGALVVRGGCIVGEGYHRRAGEPHAEILALRRAGTRARGADLYLTLEPCAHEGRTPACAPAVVASGVRRVIVAVRDANPRVAGRGLALLRKQGIEVVSAPSAWREKATAQNEKFRTWMTEGRPFVLAKWAMTLDGRTASAAGESRWITGPAARQRGLLLREEYDAVLVGAGTVLADDPRLTRRLARRPANRHWRIVLDGRLRLSEDARVFRGPGQKLLVTSVSPSHPKARRLEARGVRVWSLPARSPGRVDLSRFLAELARHEVSSLMVEGGAETLWGFFRAKLVDRVAVFIAPRVLGGSRGPGGIGGPGFALRDTPRLTNLEAEKVGGDVLLTGHVT
ncbi:MAG TPA: bifunctional diaminohydroxyphosphoribosylaminopyrimidine deaminase/5-amino-6-(5-phosphoribosylamino)uracil reductase RibD [Thermoanaerobaculia bacterium]